MKLISWNIWCDGHFESVSEFLKSSQADIVCLQEVVPLNDKFPIIDFMESLGYYCAYAPSFTTELFDGQVYEIGNAICSRAKIIGMKSWSLSTHDGRTATQADIVWEGRLIHVFSVHVLHSHGQESALRDSQVKELIRILPSKNTIVAGDFNASLDSTTVKIMQQSLINTDHVNDPTWCIKPESCMICYIDELSHRLDYIFVSNDIEYSAAAVEYADGSDHLPISVSIYIRM
jgi:endonuclease/exonuclease/phosphatase family metal-dependent hydrolase